MTDREWAILAPLIPPAKSGGRPRKTDMREVEGHEASPTSGVIDSQSVKTSESGGISGYDAVSKIKERKRHIITDTLATCWVIS